MGRIDRISDFQGVVCTAYPDESECERGMDIKDYIDRLDKDRRELELRLDRDRRDSEQRLQKNMDALEQYLREDRQLMEERLAEERRLSEERLSKSFDSLSSDMKTTKWAIIALCVSTILSVAAMVVSVIVK